MMIRIGFIKAHLSGPPPSAPKAAIQGLLLVAAPTLLRIVIDPIVTGLAFVTYFPFVLIAALLMSWGQATAVTLVSAITANYLFMEPRFTFLAEPSDTIGTLFFVIAALMIVAVGQTLRRAVRQLEESRNREAHLNRELQHRVKNTLAVVQGLASQTFRGATEVGHRAPEVLTGLPVFLGPLFGRLAVRFARWSEISTPACQCPRPRR